MDMDNICVSVLQIKVKANEAESFEMLSNFPSALWKHNAISYNAFLPFFFF